jgi:hypothetical protein
MIAFDPSSENVLSIIGTLYDMVGAVVLARGLVFVRARQILRQGRTGTWDLNPPLIKVFSEQRVDGQWGLGLLLVGFSIQGLAGYGLKSTSWALVALAMAVLITTIVIYLLVRKRLSKRGFVRACRSFQSSDEGHLSSANIEDLWQRS